MPRLGFGCETPWVLHDADGDGSGDSPPSGEQETKVVSSGGDGTYVIREPGGRERTVTSEELLTLAQKGLGADAKFAEAAKARKAEEMLRTQLPKAILEGDTDAAESLMKTAGMSDKDIDRVIGNLRQAREAATQIAEGVEEEEEELEEEVPPTRKGKGTGSKGDGGRTSFDPAELQKARKDANDALIGRALDTLRAAQMNHKGLKELLSPSGGKEVPKEVRQHIEASVESDFAALVNSRGRDIRQWGKLAEEAVERTYKRFLSLQLSRPSVNGGPAPSGIGPNAGIRTPEAPEGPPPSVFDSEKSLDWMMKKVAYEAAKASQGSKGEGL